MFTSNVDGQFQRAGFDGDRIVECHGAIEAWQCTRDCGVGIYPAPADPVVVDPSSFRAIGPLPRCPGCAALARPNVLMFGDDRWQAERTRAQGSRFEEWLAVVARTHGRLTIVECGAGVAIPTVRELGESLAHRLDATLIRINPRDSRAPARAISLASGAGAALTAIAACVEKLGAPAIRAPAS